MATLVAANIVSMASAAQHSFTDRIRLGIYFNLGRLFVYSSEKARSRLAARL
jgi:hypothetical protein